MRVLVYTRDQTDEPACSFTAWCVLKFPRPITSLASYVVRRNMNLVTKVTKLALTRQTGGWIFRDLAHIRTSQLTRLLA